jgi:hypothetical protein
MAQLLPRVVVDLDSIDIDCNLSNPLLLFEESRPIPERKNPGNYFRFIGGGECDSNSKPEAQLLPFKSITIYQ